MLLLFMVIMVEAGVTTDVFLNRDWAEVNILHTKGLCIIILKVEHNDHNKMQLGYIELYTRIFQKIRVDALISSNISSNQTSISANG